MIVPGASVVGEVFDKLAAAAAEQSDGPTLVAQKGTLAKALLDLNCRIVVAIDDVDRLEPTEVAELLRLVRSVADFPNVSYLLCYDGPTLARAIETGTGVSSGAAYLEKIVQTEVAVPRSESFALRRWFTKELHTFVVCDEARLPVLQQVTDETGGRVLNNPRAVIRVLDSLRVFWPSLAGSVDVPDLVWLRLIAVGAPNFYRWVEDYLVTFAAMTSGRIHLSDEDRLAAVRDMEAAMASDGLSWERDQYELERHLPGINLFTFGMDGERRLYSHEDRAALARAAADKALQAQATRVSILPLWRPRMAFPIWISSGFAQPSMRDGQRLSRRLPSCTRTRAMQARRKQSACSISFAIRRTRPCAPGRSRASLREWPTQPTRWRKTRSSVGRTGRISGIRSSR